MDLLAQLGRLIDNMSAIDFIALAIGVYFFSMLSDMAGDWADKQERKKKKQEQKRKGFIPPLKKED